MTASLLYRVAAALLTLFAIGNAVIFRRTYPSWGVDSVIDGMRNTRFEIQGLSRTIWDFYTGFGLFTTVFLLLAAVISWQLGGLSKEMLRSLSLIVWGLAMCLLVIAVVSWKYFLVSTGVAYSVAALLLLVAAILVD